MDWYPSARWTVVAEPTLSWLDYENPQRMPLREYPRPEDRPEPHQGPMQQLGPGVMLADEERDDVVGDLTFEVLRAVAPGFDVSLRGGVARRESSLDTEDNWQYRGGAGLAWNPAAGLHLSASLQGMRIYFDDAPESTDRTDDVWQAAAAAGYVWGRATLFVRLDHVDYDSSFASEQYEKTVTRCGFGYSF